MMTFIFSLLNFQLTVRFLFSFNVMLKLVCSIRFGLGITTLISGWLGVSLGARSQPSSPPPTPVEQSLTQHPVFQVATTPLPFNGFTSTQKASLRALEIPIVIPNYVPNRFQVAQVKANLCKSAAPQRGNCREGSNYTIVYRNPQNSCLIVSAIGGGVGGGAGEYEFRTQTNLLGEVSILFGKTSGENRTPSPDKLRQLQPNLFSFPAMLKVRATRSPYYSVTVGDDAYYQQTYRCGKNTNITPLEFEKIVQSLYVVK